MARKKVSFLPLLGIGLFLLGFFARGFLPAPPAPLPSPTPTNIVQPTQCTPGPQTGEYVVTHVLDGDTIRISTGEKVRYFGVDTPELNEEWSTEATRYNSELVLGKTVRLELDRPVLDKYGRTLGYVWVRDREGREVLVNKLILEEGYSKLNVIKSDPKLKYLDILTEAEGWGKFHHNGVWLREWVK